MTLMQLRDRMCSEFPENDFGDLSTFPKVPGRVENSLILDSRISALRGDTFSMDKSDVALKSSSDWKKTLPADYV